MLTGRVDADWWAEQSASRRRAVAALWRAAKAEGWAHCSKTLRARGVAVKRASVLECVQPSGALAGRTRSTLQQSWTESANGYGRAKFSQPPPGPWLRLVRAQQIQLSQPRPHGTRPQDQ